MQQIAKLIYTPRFFSFAKADQDFKPDLAAAYREGYEYARAHHLKPAQQLLKDGVAHALMMTDLQGDFRDRGRLPVKGTDAVVLRTCVRLINGIVEDYFAGVIFSLDGHPPQHRSFDHNYVDQDGNLLDLSKHGRAAILTLADERKALFKATAFGASGPYEVGIYQPRFDPRDAVEYWKHLQATGQGDIWAFVSHCVIGSDGANLHPLLAETIAFVCGARSLQPTIIHKGHLEKTDWFGPLMPCRPDPDHAQGGFQKRVIDTFKQYVTVEYAGVAEDFCDYHMKKQTMDNLQGTEYLPKLRFLTDCTAPIVPNAPHVKALNDEAKAAGVKFISHDAPFEA